MAECACIHESQCTHGPGCKTKPPEVDVSDIERDGLPVGKLIEDGKTLDEQTASAYRRAQGDRLHVLAHTIAQAMADHENEHRYELTTGSQSTGVEPYEYGASDFEEIAEFVAKRLESGVTPREVTARADVTRVEHLQQQMGES